MAIGILVARINARLLLHEIAVYSMCMNLGGDFGPVVASNVPTEQHRDRKLMMSSFSLPAAFFCVQIHADFWTSFDRESRYIS